MKDKLELIVLIGTVIFFSLFLKLFANKEKIKNTKESLGL